VRSSKLTRTATVAAIAATAGMAIAGTASAATPPKAAAAKTTLAVAEAKDVITGTLTSGKAALAKETVYLETVAGKKVAVVGKGAVTSKAGKVTFTVKPTATTTYELVFKGTAKLAASHSTAITVKVAIKTKA
jgi:hypothetical protein